MVVEETGPDTSARLTSWTRFLPRATIRSNGEGRNFSENIKCIVQGNSIEGTEKYKLGTDERIREFEMITNASLKR
jgi:hypothetical protein